MFKDNFAYIIVLILVALVLYGFLGKQNINSNKGTKLTNSEKQDTLEVYKLPSITIPDELYFAGERVPVDDHEVRERLDRELHVNTFFHSNTFMLLKLGNRWLPTIERELVKNGVPADLKYLAVIESDLRNKTSYRDAVGFWQLLEGTAEEYGLEVDRYVDERYHPIKSTQVAAKYLMKAYKKFGSWTEAAASYNIGMRGLSENLAFQKVDSYYDLYLNDETGRYIPRAIAVKMIFENPEKYGFDLSEDQLYHMQNFKAIEVDQSITNLQEFAFDHGITYKILKTHNPWLRDRKLIVSRNKKYTILIPE